MVTYDDDGSVPGSRCDGPGRKAHHRWDGRCRRVSRPCLIPGRPQSLPSSDIIGPTQMSPRNLLYFLMAASAALAQNGTQAGTFVVEHPTLLNLGFEWAIRGDANRNASVAVQFRAVGETAWRHCSPASSDRRRATSIASARTSTTPCPTDLPAASSTSARAPNMSASFSSTRPGRRHRPELANRASQDPHRTAALRKWAHAPRLPADYRAPAWNRVSPAFWRPTTARDSAIGTLSGSGAPNPAIRLLVHAGLYKPERLNYVDPHDDAV